MTVRWCHPVSRVAVFALRSNILVPRRDVKLAGGNVGESKWLPLVPAAQRLHFTATDSRRGGVRCRGQYQSWFTIAQFPEQILRPVQTRISLSNDLHRGSTRNAAPTRPQPTVTWVPTSTSLQWFVDGWILTLAYYRQGSERWAQSAWVIPSNSVGNLNIKHWPSPRF